MNKQKCYLSKKRKQIFEILKTSKKWKKVECNNNDCFEIIKVKNKSLNKSNQKSKEKNKKNKDNQQQRLIGISKLVLEYIKEKKKTTGNQVFEYIYGLFNLKNDDELIQKNIQRRVYDSINIMGAIGRIKKNKQMIEYIEYKNENNKDNNNENIIITQNESNTKYSKIDKNQKEEIINGQINNKENMEEKLKKLENLQKVLINNYLTLKYCEKLAENKEEAEKKSNDKIKFPFEVKQSNIPEFPKKIKSKNILNNHSTIESLNIKSLISYDSIKKIMAPEILPKLNHSDNLETNNENFINKPINNINVNIDKKFINDSKSNKFKNNKDINEEEDEIFNYLKNLKLFRDEITLNQKTQNFKNNI